MPSFANGRVGSRAAPGQIGFGIFAPGARPLLMPRFNPPLKNFTISGTTRDSTGAALGSCTVHLFRTGDDSEVGQITSDGSGNFTFTISANSGNFYIVAYLPGGTDKAGTSVNTLVGV